MSSPEERIEEAQKAAENEEMDVDDFLLYFTKASADVLRSADGVAKRVNSLAYIKNLRKLVPKGEVTKVEEHGNMRLLTLLDGKVEVVVRMLPEEGEWCIDGLALEAFWKPMKEAPE